MRTVTWGTVRDAATCDACAALRGRKAKSDAWTGSAPPLAGCTNPDGCRCLLVWSQPEENEIDFDEAWDEGPRAHDLGAAVRELRRAVAELAKIVSVLPVRRVRWWPWRRGGP